tara:strand:+ start:8599 stop:8826 length:228 start_codon:yes stop_codon:yes gene_type:complete
MKFGGGDLNSQGVEVFIFRFVKSAGATFCLSTDRRRYDVTTRLSKHFEVDSIISSSHVVHVEQKLNENLDVKGLK